MSQNACILPTNPQKKEKSQRKTHLAIINTLNITTPIGSALLKPTGNRYLRFQLLSSITLPAPKRIAVLSKSIALSITDAKSEIELETKATITLSVRRMTFYASSG